MWRFKVDYFKFNRFLGAGAVGFIADSAIYFFLQEVAKLPPIVCKLGAVLPALTLTWYINRRFTFATSQLDNIFLEYVKYLLASALGAGANICTMMLIIRYDADYHHVPAYFVGTVAGLVANFLLYEFFVFKPINNIVK